MMKQHVIRQLKYDQARLQVMRYIAESGLHPGDRLLSEQDLLSHVSCSIITLRHALEDLSDAGVIERRRGSGTYLSHSIQRNYFSDTILFINVTLDGEDMPGLSMDPVHRYFARCGIGLKYLLTTSFSEEVVAAASEHCLGIMVCGWLTEEFMVQLLSLRLPVVVIGNSLVTVDVPVVSLDLELGAYRLTRIMHEDGACKIGLIRGSESYYPAVEAERGYRRGLAEFGGEPLVLQVDDPLGYYSSLSVFMESHGDVDGLLMEHTTFFDFMTWCWKHQSSLRPAIGFMSSPKDYRRFVQDRKFLWLHYEKTSMRASKMLLDHIVDGTPMVSVKLAPVIPLVDTDDDSFIG